MDIQYVINLQETLFKKVGESTTPPGILERAKKLTYHSAASCILLQKETSGTLSDNVVIHYHEIFNGDVRACPTCNPNVLPNLRFIKTNAVKAIDCLRNVIKVEAENKYNLEKYLTAVKEAALALETALPKLLNLGIPGEELELWEDAIRDQTTTTWLAWSRKTVPDVFGVDNTKAYLHASRTDANSAFILEAFEHNPDNLKLAAQNRNDLLLESRVQTFQEYGYTLEELIPVFNTRTNTQFTETVLALLSDGTHWLDALKAAKALEN